MTDLHLISWNRPKMTELVIKTIHKNTYRDDFRLVVLDNGSEGDTPDMLQGFQDNGLIDELFLIKTNLGLEAARNFLLKNATTTDYFVDIDNDCLPPPNWLPRQLELMQKYEDYAAIAQRTQIMIGTGNIFEDETKDITDFPHPGGSFRMMNTKAVFEVGGWDRKSSGRGQEERYICGKLREDGYKTGFATHIKCLHLFGNRKQTKERWGYKEGMTPAESGHSDIWHPALENGDDPNDIRLFSGAKLTEEYMR